MGADVQVSGRTLQGQAWDVPGQRTEGSAAATRPGGVRGRGVQGGGERCPEDKGLWPVGFGEDCRFYFCMGKAGDGGFGDKRGWCSEIRAPQW